MQTFDYDMVPRQRDNRLTGVAGGSVSATFLYDAEGNRVKGTVAGVTTVYIAGLYEYQNGAVTKYYEGGALRRTGYATDNGVFYVVSDHLRSTSVLVNRDGTVKSRNFYYPYGGNRGGSAFSGVTTKRFTGQYHEQGLPGGEGLAFYNARWYDAQVGAFISADTLVPSPLAPQTLNRYAYVGGNPLRYTDPTGHMLCADCDGGGGGYRTRTEPKRVWLPFISFQSPARPQPPVVRSGGVSVVVQPRAPLPTLTPFVGPIAPPAGLGVRAGGFQADDGVFLIYQIRGYLRPRIETVYYSVGGASPVASGGIEHRHVTTLRGIFNWSVYETYDEVAGGGALGPFGGEVATNPDGTSVMPVFGVDRGLVLTLQPGQFMIGATNPFGPGGLRIGADFRWTQNRFVVTSAGTLTAAGGTSAFGWQKVHKDALLVSQTHFSGGSGVSGFERAQGVVRWSVVGSIMEVVP